MSTRRWKEIKIRGARRNNRTKRQRPKIRKKTKGRQDPRSHSKMSPGNLRKKIMTSFCSIGISSTTEKQSTQHRWCQTCDSTKLQLNNDSMVEFAITGHEKTIPWLRGEKREVFGSSFAAPRVSAMLAQILSAYPNTHPLHAKSLLRQLALQSWQR